MRSRSAPYSLCVNPFGRVTARLEVRVKALRSLSIAFFFVKDRFDDTTRRDRAIVDSLFTQLNDIYPNQTNIEFNRDGLPNLDVEAATSFRDIIREQDRRGGQLGPEADKLAGNIAQAGDIQVFFVPSPPGATRVLADRNRVCIVPDAMSDDQVRTALPNGVGIILGGNPTVSERRQDDLMFERRAEGHRDGFFIPKDEVEVMNPL